MDTEEKRQMEELEKLAEMLFLYAERFHSHPDQMARRDA